MLTLNATTLAAMNAKGVKTFYLYIIDYDPPNAPFRWTSWSDSIVYDSNTYVPFAVKHSEFKQDVDGKISPMVISVGNLDEARTVQTVIENYDVIGKMVTIKQFFFNSSGNLIDDSISTTFKIIAAKTSKGQVDFTASIGFDYLLATIPARTMYRRYCRWDFQDANCKFAGSPTPTCEKTWEDCVSRSNTVNFGGFPAILSHHFYF